MPIYEYRCPQCGVFEINQKITADPLKECPHCGAQVNRLISRNVNVLYKGSGFYTTEYRSNEYKEKAKEESGSGEAKSEKAS